MPHSKSSTYIVRVAMSMIISTVGMSMSSTAMRVRVSMLECIDSNEIYNEPEDTHNEESFVLYFRGLQDPLNSFRKYKKCYEQQKESIHKSSKYFRTHVAVAELVIRTPLCDYLKKKSMYMLFLASVTAIFECPVVRIYNLDRNSGSSICSL